MRYGSLTLHHPHSSPSFINPLIITQRTHQIKKVVLLVQPYIITATLPDPHATPHQYINLKIKQSSANTTMMEDDDGNNHAKKGNITESSLSVASNNNNNNNDNDNDNREAVPTINSVSDVGNGPPSAAAASSTTTTQQVGAANTQASFQAYLANIPPIIRASEDVLKSRKIYNIYRPALTSTSTSTSTSTPTMSTTTSAATAVVTTETQDDTQSGSLFVASNNNNNNNNSSEEAAAPETSNSVSTSTPTPTPSTTSAATAVRSDIAAAVLKDSTMHEMIKENNGSQSRENKRLVVQIVDELLKENNELQSRENKRLVVQITGKNGTPIYFEGSLKNAERYGDDHIVLRFKNGSRDGFPLSSIEIRLGGVKVQQVNIDDITIYFYNDGYDEENRMQYIWLNLFSDRGPNISGPIVRMMDAKIGPLPLGWRQRHVVGDGIDMLLTNFLELVADENNDLTPQTLKIKALVFDEKTIPGLMSFVTKEMTNYT